MNKFHRFPRPRMGKGQAVRPEGDLTGIIDFRVLPFSHQGESPAGKLHPDLMGPARLQPDAHLGKIFRGRKPLIVQRRLLDALGGGVSNVGHPSCLVPAQQVPEGFLLFRYTMEHRQIFFFKFPFPNLPGKLRSGLGISRQHHQAADHPIQSVNGANICFCVSKFLPKQIRQAAGFIGGQHPGRLHADHNIRIQINNFHTALPIHFSYPIKNPR